MDKVAKQAALDALRAEIAAAALPLMPANLVFGEGDPDARVCFIGEAPGFNEDREGRPFVGRAGKLLDELIRSVDWKREEVYITNIVKRRPPDNRDPLPEEIEAYKPYLARQIEILDPPIIAPLGRFSMNYFLPLGKITRDQGKAFSVDGRVIFPLLHPAAALRNPEAMKALRESFSRLPAAAETAIKEKTSATAMENAVPEAAPVARRKEPPVPPQIALF